MKIHVIEDDNMFSRLIGRALQFDNDVEVVSFFNGSDFLSKLHDNPDAVTLNLSLPDYSGFDLFKKIKAFNPDIEVIIISGQDDVKVAVQLLREGAYDYITKDENIKERLQHCIGNLSYKKQLKEEISQLKSEVSRKYGYENAIVGDSPAIKDVYSLVEKAVRIHNINVSIQGDPGTGKEMIAKIIHYNSNHKDKPFVKINISSVPRELMEGELFGYENGALSGGYMAKRGRIEEASEGTIFIEDIDELDMEMQMKLLRVLKERELTRVGGSIPVAVNVRIISATNRDLSESVRERKFREDLYFRLMGLPIHLPPLKDRQKDIVLLSKHFLKIFCRENNMGMLSLTSRARRKLLSYNFPGNVRELKAVIELAAVLTNRSEVDEEHIIFNSSHEALDLFSREMTLKEYNDLIIKYFMDKYNNVMKVAEKLDIGKSTIYNYLKSEKEKLFKRSSN